MATFFAALGIITFDEVAKLKRWPHPDRYGRAIIIWAILGLISDLGAPQLATIFAAGLVLTLLYQYYNTGTVFINGSTETQTKPEARNS